MCAVGETTKAKPLASFKVSQNKSKVLHGHSLPCSVQIRVVRGRHVKNKIEMKPGVKRVYTYLCMSYGKQNLGNV